MFAIYLKKVMPRVWVQSWWRNLKPILLCTATMSTLLWGHTAAGKCKYFPPNHTSQSTSLPLSQEKCHPPFLLLRECVSLSLSSLSWQNVNEDKQFRLQCLLLHLLHETRSPNSWFTAQCLRDLEIRSPAALSWHNILLPVFKIIHYILCQYRF